MMKNYLFGISLTMFLMAGSLVSIGQEKILNDEISLGYGVATINDFEDLFEDLLTDIVTLGSYTTDNIKSTGTLLGTYRGSLGRVVYMGAAIGYETLSKDVFVLNKKVGKLDRQFLTLAIEFQFRYIRARVFQMYSGVGLGYTFNKDKYKPLTGEEKTGNYNHVSFQANLLGFRIGRSLGFFIEGGFGYKGLVNAGLSIEF